VDSIGAPPHARAVADDAELLVAGGGPEAGGLPWGGL